MFCKSGISKLPDISKWNTKNVINFKAIFCGCDSLSILPDISKWNTENVKTLQYIFYNCMFLL